MINRVTLLGNLGADPEVRRLDSGAVVATLNVATNENYKDKAGEWQQITEWHRVVAWRALAERCESQLKKGDQVYIEGKLTHRTWQADDGTNRRTTEVVARMIRKISPKREGQAREEKPGYFPAPADEPAQVGPEDDLPF